MIDEFDGEDLSIDDELEAREKRLVFRVQFHLQTFWRNIYNILTWNVVASRHINDEKIIKFSRKKILLEKTRIDSKGNPIIDEHDIYCFEIFDCFKIIEHENFENNEYLCSIQVNEKSDMLQIKKNKRDLKQFFDESSFVAKSANLTKLFFIIFDEYLNVRRPERVKVSKVLGFTKENGWTLPPKFELEESSEIQTEIIKRIKEALWQPPRDVKKKFQDFYTAIFVEHKDICFAYTFCAPFFYALKDKSNLVPFLIFLSAENDTAKTQMAGILTTFIFNHQPLLTSANCQSLSRFGDYFTATTFPLAIDEVNALKDTHLDILKSISTAEVYNTKKRADQSIKTHKPYQCPAILTCNSLPEIFSDPALLSRTLIVKFDQKPTKLQREDYHNTKKELKPGEIFAFFYHQTRELTYDDMLKMYEETDTLPELELLNDPRSKTIYRLLSIGKILCKRVFDIDLDISKIGSLLDEKRSYSQTEDILQAFNSYITLQYQKHYENQRDFSVKAQFFFRPNKTKSDVVITALNRREMAKLWHLDNISHDMLKSVLKDDYKVHESDVHKFEKKTIRGLRVQVPLSFFNDTLGADAQPETQQPLELEDLTTQLHQFFEANPMGEFPLTELEAKFARYKPTQVRKAVKYLYERRGAIYEPEEKVYKKL